MDAGQPRQDAGGLPGTGRQPHPCAALVIERHRLLVEYQPVAVDAAAGQALVGRGAAGRRVLGVGVSRILGFEVTAREGEALPALRGGLVRAQARAR